MALFRHQFLKLIQATVMGDQLKRKVSLMTKAGCPERGFTFKHYRLVPALEIRIPLLLTQKDIDRLGPEWAMYAYVHDEWETLLPKIRIWLSWCSSGRECLAWLPDEAIELGNLKPLKEGATLSPTILNQITSDPDYEKLQAICFSSRYLEG